MALVNYTIEEPQAVVVQRVLDLRQHPQEIQDALA